MRPVAVDLLDPCRIKYTGAMDSEKRYGLHGSMGYLVNRLAGSMHAAFDRRAEALDVTAAQWAVLIALFNDDAATPGELTRFVGVDGAAITRLLDRLEAKGLVAREPHASDRRAVMIRLTDAGRRLTPQIVAISREENERFLEALNMEEREQFLTLLHQLVRDLPA